MIDLPIADRELRIAARARRTYQSRAAAAGVAMLLFFCIFWMRAFRFGPAGTGIFDALTALGFIYCLLSGPLLTADCISAEKREGTLGLLFLSTLKPREIVFGNLVATSLKAFYGLIAMLPILAMSLILGGVQYDEFGKVCLALVSTLLFSLIFSMVISAVSEQHWMSAGRALVGLLTVALGIPAFCAGFRRLSAAPFAPSTGVMAAFESLSPLSAVRLASGLSGTSRGHDYWRSILAVNLLTAGLLGLCCMILSRVWRDRVIGISGISWREIFRRQRFGNSIARRKSRNRLLEANPFYWLAIRSRAEMLKTGALFLLLALLAEWVATSSLTRIIGGKYPALVAHLVAWGALAFGMHLVLLWQATFYASHRLADDRKSGALELLLVTPMKIGRLLRGHWRAFVGQLLPLVFALLMLDAVILWGTLVMWGMEREIPGGAKGIILEMAMDFRSGQGNIPPEIYCLLTAMVGGGLLSLLHCLAIGCIGIWIALTNKRTSMVPWVTGAMVLATPLPFFLGLLILADLAGASRNIIFWMWLIVLSGLSLGAWNDLIFIGWSLTRTASYFRTAAAGQFREEIQKAEKVPIPRVALRLGYAVAIFAGIIVLFYGEEKWRGWEAWRRLEKEYASRGAKPETHWTRPARVPDEQNFGVAPIFSPLFAYTLDGDRVVWKDVDTHDRLMGLSVTGKPRNFWQKTTNEPFADWRLQKPADFQAWREYYTTNYFPVGSQSNSAVESVLNALTVFEPELKELEEYSKRPFAVFPIHYEDGLRAYFPHWSVLANCAEILQLKAAAELELGDADHACTEIEIAFRLAASLKVEPGIHSLNVKHIMLLGTLQPTWEGLRKHRWNTTQLTRLEKLLEANLLADYKRGVQSQMTLVASYWDIFLEGGDFRLTEFDGMQAARHFYPSGWKFLNQTRLLRFCDERLVPMIDSDSHQAFPAMQKGIARALASSGVLVDPLFHVILATPQIYAFVEAAPHFTHAQVSLDEARLGCALERYYQSHSAFPEQLSALVPGEVEVLPTDPISGKSYRYVRDSPGHFVLYSTGWNQADDLGVTVSARSYTGVFEQNILAGDWVWKYSP